ncbi:MAG: helix repeat-containing protein [Pedosphaera sp.]|nr:helix repeat-containing protein [Pedosphaera sp.]
MNNAGVNLRTGLESAWTSFMAFIPNLFLFLVILVVGYFVARVVARVLDRVLHRVGFDRLVERGGIKQVMERTKWTPSDVVSAIIFWTIFLFVLELAFSVFGPNPISTIILGIIAYLPNLFAAILIVVVAAAVAAAAKQILQATLGGFSYGRAVANTVSAAIWVIGVFAALNQLGIAPAIVNGLFYAMLVIIVGSAVISIGVGGIAPMRALLERALGRVQAEAPNIKAAATKAAAAGTGQPWQPIAAQQPQPEEHERELPETPRFPTQP